MNYSKHSKPVQRNAADAEPERDQMGMNWQKTRDNYITREVVWEEEDEELEKYRKKQILDEMQSQYKPIRNGVVRRYGK